MKLPNSINIARTSWHVYDHNTQKFIAHTAIGEVVEREWSEMYDDGPLIVQCTSIGSSGNGVPSKFEVSANTWYDNNGCFVMTVTHEDKAGALAMYGAALKAHNDNQ